MLSSWHRTIAVYTLIVLACLLACECSLCSHDEHRTAPSGCRPLDQAKLANQLELQFKLSMLWVSVSLRFHLCFINRQVCKSCHTGVPVWVAQLRPNPIRPTVNTSFPLEFPQQYLPYRTGFAPDLTT